MEYNHPSDLIKELNFGQDAKSKIKAKLKLFIYGRIPSESNK